MPNDRERRVGAAAPWAAVLVGAALLGKTLVVPFWRDDVVQRAMAIGGFPAPRGPFSLYDFVRADERARFVDLGLLPWWTDDDYRIRFFRPLASAEIWLEHRFVGSAIAMHAISLVWWAAMVLAAGWLFRRVIAPRPAAIATLIFALAPCHVPALALVAQREVLMSVAFGALALGLLARAESVSTRTLGLAALAFAGALGAGEYAVCLAGYAMLQAISGESSNARRVRLAIPFALPAAVYLVTRAGLGYGATGTGFYRDPAASPWRFLVHAPRTWFELVADVFTTLTADGASAVWLAVAAIAALAVLLAARECPAWLKWGSLLALVPVMGSAPGTRLVAPALLGAAPALAVVVDRAISNPKRLVALVPAVAIVALHLGHAPIASARQANDELAWARAHADRGSDLADHAEPGKVGVVALASWDTAFLTAVAAGRPRVMPWRVLVNARHALVLRRDARTIDVVVPRGQGFFPAGTDDIFRPEDHPLEAGAVRDVPGMHVELTSAAAAAPRIRFTFDRDLEDTSLVWLTEKRTGYEGIAPPAVGYGLSLSP